MAARRVGILLRGFGSLARDFGGGLRAAAAASCGLSIGACVLPWSGRGGLRLEARMHDGAVFGQRGRLDDLVVPVDGERLLFLVDQDIEEVEAGSCA